MCLRITLSATSLTTNDPLPRRKTSFKLKLCQIFIEFKILGHSNIGVFTLAFRKKLSLVILVQRFNHNYNVSRC